MWGSKCITFEDGGEGEGEEEEEEEGVNVQSVLLVMSDAL